MTLVFVFGINNVLVWACFNCKVKANAFYSIEDFLTVIIDIVIILELA